MRPTRAGTPATSVSTEEWNERKHIYGTLASLHIDDTSADAPLIQYRAEDRKPRAVELERPNDLFGYTIGQGIRHHVDHLINGTPLLYTTDLAIEALRLILACYRSNELGRHVEVREIE